MHRFYLPPERCAGNALRLDGREAHHALHVLRLKRGERVAVLDGAGNEFFCEVENAAKDSLALVVKEKKSTPALPCAITLLVAVPKGKIIEGIIQKAVELGAYRIVPLLTERVVTQLDGEGAESKREKWQQVAIEAIKQCGAAWLSKVEVPQTISEFLARAEKIELSLVGSLQTERRHPRERILEFEKQHGRLPHSAGVWIGPEGDFTLAELQAIEAAGAKPVTLGELTLRVETAAIYCLSFLNYELQTWRDVLTMKLPPDTQIATEKLTRYLLVRQARADKSQFLAQAGYNFENADQLLADLRDQILPLDATPAETNQFGDFFEIRARLTGPNGVVLRVRTIWLTDPLSGRTKFVTLLPDKKTTP